MTDSTLLSQTPARRIQSCIGEYERIKRRESTAFKTVKDFCPYHGFSRRNFMKIYHRCRQDPGPDSLSATAWAEYRTRRVDLQTGERIINLHRQGDSRCEIRDILRENAASVPGPTAICNICRRHGPNRLHRVQKRERMKIVMNRIGESVHIDCRQLSKGITPARPGRTCHLPGPVDGYSRPAQGEVPEDKKALTVMFATLKAFNILRRQYGPEVEAVITDSGAEFDSGPAAKKQRGSSL
ncbi:MAG: hypothetical protein LBB73_04645 [Dysgonamonadaceae bacterium]|jgi:hypothetical protein|nr:hypothetical protein [Dysgonamonadaceae bacterium]